LDFFKLSSKLITIINLSFKYEGVYMALIGKDGKDGTDGKKVILDRKYCNMEHINHRCSEELSSFLQSYNLSDETHEAREKLKP